LACATFTVGAVAVPATVIEESAAVTEFTFVADCKVVTELVSVETLDWRLVIAVWLSATAVVYSLRFVESSGDEVEGESDQ
jgi:hypothetical protein